MNRRDFLQQAQLLGTSAIGAASLLPTSLFAQSDEEVVPFADTKPFNPQKPLLQWEQLKSWQTPPDQLFWVGHYGIPAKAPADWSLEIGGLVEKPVRLNVD